MATVPRSRSTTPAVSSTRASSTPRVARRSNVLKSRAFHDVFSAVAAFFAAIHFRWVEFPGLFVFGLILGVCALRTGRLGMGIAAHMAFNATGLLLVARI